MNKITLYYYREVNSITCICGYVKTCHTGDLVIYGAITIDPCTGNCQVCQEEVEKGDYYNCR